MEEVCLGSMIFINTIDGKGNATTLPSLNTIKLKRNLIMSKSIYTPTKQFCKENYHPIDDTGIPEDAVLFNPELNREEALERNRDIIECPNCNRVGNRPNMMRWHFENCKMKTRYCIECNNPIPKKYKASQYKNMKYCDHKCYGKSRIGQAWGHGIAINN